MIGDPAPMGQVSETAAAQSSAAPGRWTVAFFVLAAALFAAVTLAMSALPIAERSLPPGGSDAYSYISKARVMRDCPMLECRTMEELRAQLAPDPDESYVVERARWAQAHRAVYWYHPLHSLALIGLKAAGLGWEAGLNALALFGAAATVLGIAWFLFALTGPGPAAFGMLVLAFTVHPGFHGIHWFVPSNIALGLAFWIWAALLSRLRGAAWWLPAGALVIAGLHPIGKIFAIMALALYAYDAWHERVAPRRIAAVATATVAAAMVPEIVGWATGHPALARPEPPWPEGASYLGGVAANAGMALAAVEAWLAGLGGWVAALFLAVGAAGFMVWDEGRGRLPAALFLAAAVSSLLFVFPDYEAELFVRLWVPAAAVLSALVGRALWQLLRREGPWRLAGVRGPVRLGALAIAGLLALYVATARVSTGVVDLARTYRAMTTWTDTRVDNDQPIRLAARLAPDERILFAHEYPLYHYMSYGPLDRGLVYEPAVSASARADEWLNAARGLRYAMTYHPVYNGWMPLTPGITLEIDAPDPLPADTALRVVNNGGSTMITVNGAARIPVPERWSGWLDLPEAARTTHLHLSLPRGAPDLHLTGLRLSADQPTGWAWGNGLRIHLVGARRGWGKGPTGPFPLELETRLPPECVAGDVLEDFGGFVVFAVSCTQSRSRPSTP